MKDFRIDVRIKLVLLWAVVMFNMIFADIFALVIEFVDGGMIEIPFDASIMMAIAAVMTNVPILMVLFSYILPFKANRLANITVAIYTILYVVAGGYMTPHYFVMAGIEIVLLIIIVVTSWRWTA